jgi:5-methylcytosine-specific restriction protein A
MTRLRSAPARLAWPASRLASTATAGSGFARSDGRTAAQRGYDSDWRRLRAEVLQAEPLCRLCRSAPATEVDHIAPFHGLHDPLRLARGNVRPVCVLCHRRRTARQSHGCG